MERLTSIYGTCIKCVDCKDYLDCDDMCSAKDEALKILKKYEDTNLTPDQFKELDKLYLEKCEEVNRLNKKEIPSKPLSDTYGFAGEVPHTKYMCPTGCCKIAIHRERDNYCPNCGQVIDWKVEE